MYLEIEAFGNTERLSFFKQGPLLRAKLPNGELWGTINVPIDEFVEHSYAVRKALSVTDHYVIKTYSENRDWVPQLLEAGLFEETGNKFTRTFPAHSVDFPIWKLTDLGRTYFGIN